MNKENAQFILAENKSNVNILQTKNYDKVFVKNNMQLAHKTVNLYLQRLLYHLKIDQCGRDMLGKNIQKFQFLRIHALPIVKSQIQKSPA